MQNLQTGEMMELPDDYNKLANQKATPDSLKKIQEFEDRFLDRDKQGPVFHVGEEIIIKGGRFRLHSIGKQGLVFHGLPGTKFQKGE